MRQRGNLGDARAVNWDDESDDWSGLEAVVEFSQPSHRRAWMTRQLIAAIWIVVAWAVGTLVFEMGAVG